MKEILSKSLASRDIIFLRLAKRFKNASKIEISILKNLNADLEGLSNVFGV